MHSQTLNLLEKYISISSWRWWISKNGYKTRFKKHIVDHFFVAKDGLEGLEVFKKYPIDIIITDIHMPNFKMDLRW